MPAISKADVTAALAAFPWDDWRADLKALYEPIYRAVVTSQGTRVMKAPAKRVKKTPDPWHADNPHVKKFLNAYAGERITQLDDTTREWVKDSILSAMDETDGVGATELAARIVDAASDSRAFDPARALNIARTEVATAVGHGTGLAYKQQGIDKVLISDGDGDEACAEADGEVWTTDYYLANVLEHPGCERSASPADEADEVDRE